MNTNLINSKTMNDIALLLYNQKNKETGLFTWILEHKILTIIICVIIYFIYKKYKELSTENFMFEFKNTLGKDNKYHITADNSMATPYIRPTMNPTIPINNQTSYVRYLPNEYPYKKIDGLLNDHSGKLVKNGSILPDQGIPDMNYTFTPIPGEQNKGPQYRYNDMTSYNEMVNREDYFN